jgi:hypothetical protein
MSDLTALLILAAAAAALLAGWKLWRRRSARLQVWPATQPLPSVHAVPARPSESVEALRLRRHMALRVQHARTAREAARKPQVDAGSQGFAETTIQEDQRP